jgi:hypothetical protein
MIGGVVIVSGVLLQTLSGQDAVIKDGRKNAITLQYQVFF